MSEKKYLNVGSLIRFPGKKANDTFQLEVGGEVFQLSYDEMEAVEKQILEQLGVAKVQIDNENLDPLINLLDTYYQKAIEPNFVNDDRTMKLDDIRAAQKLPWNDPNRLNRIDIVLFDPNENAPSFIKKSASIKIADYV